MAFCSNCGNKLEEGDQFCGKCGSLNGNAAVEKSMGQTASSSMQASVKSTAFDGDSIKRYFGEIWSVAKGMIVAPGTTIVKAGEVLSKEACFIMFGLMAIVQGILSIWSISAVNGSVNSQLSKMPFIGGLMGGLKLPYFKMFLGSTFTLLVAGAALFGALYLIGKSLFKAEVKPLNVLKIVVASFVPYLAAVLVQILLSYISVAIALVPMMFGILVSIISLYEGVKQEFKLTTDKTIILIAISYLIMIIAIYIISTILIKSYFKSVQNKFMKNDFNNLFNFK